MFRRAFKNAFHADVIDINGFYRILQKKCRRRISGAVNHKIVFLVVFLVFGRIVLKKINSFIFGEKC